MNRRSSIREQLRVIAALAGSLADTHVDEIEGLCEMVLATLRSGRRLFFCGNGGSAADAQHLAAEYLVRFSRERASLPAMALTTDTSVLTATSNDLGFDQVFARQLDGLAGEGDLLILHSTSGVSKNLLVAANAARRRGVKTAALLAKGGGPLQAEVDLAVVLPTDSTARAQELQLAVGHIVCDLVESELFPPGEGNS